MSETLLSDHDAGAPVPLGRVIGRVSRTLRPERIGAGALAELRRMNWREFPLGFWRFYLEHAPIEWREPAGRPDDRIDLAWAGVLRAMAEAAPDPHVPNNSLGAALAETGYAEMRFVRYLRADGEELARETRIAAAWLARKGRKADWRAPAELVLGRIGRLGRGVLRPDRVAHRLARRVLRPDRVAHRLARDYFAAQAAASRTSDRS